MLYYYYLFNIIYYSSISLYKIQCPVRPFRFFGLCWLTAVLSVSRRSRNVLTPNWFVDRVQIWRGQRLWGVYLLSRANLSPAYFKRAQNISFCTIGPKYIVFPNYSGICMHIEWKFDAYLVNEVEHAYGWWRVLETSCGSYVETAYLCSPVTLDAHEWWTQNPCIFSH